MQSVFTMRRQGFNKKIQVGEIIRYENEEYVLTHIVEINHFYNKSARIEARGIAQLISGNSNFKEYKIESDFTINYSNGDFSDDEPLYRVGDIIEEDGVCGVISNISSIEYESFDFVVTYQLKLFRPWSKEEMDKAVKEYRLSKFTVYK